MALSVVSVAQTSSDNSKVNERDRAATELTSDQQKVNEVDTKITTLIRQDIMKEKNFSTYAQNVKIITLNGVVTLKGPVRTKSEERRILQHARSVAGVVNVINEMAIAPKKTKQ